MMEKEKRRMELEVARISIHQENAERQTFELRHKLSEERRRILKERVKGKVPVCIISYPQRGGGDKVNIVVSQEYNN